MTHDDTTAHLAGGLPAQFPSNPSSGNYKLLQPVAEQLDENANDIDEVDAALSVQDADDIAELEELGKLVSVLPNEGETLAHYRARVLAEYNTLTSEGTIEDLLNAAAEIISVEKTDLQYENVYVGEHGAVFLGLPAQGIDNTPLSDTEIINILDRVLSASYRLEGGIIGTFTYITPEDYNAGDFDASKGYDGLDANGDPKNNGGTYAGLIT